MGDKKKLSNVFDIQVGVCIAFFIKTPMSRNRRQKLFYYELKDEQTRKEKLYYLEGNLIEHIAFRTLYPDGYHNWLNITRNDFEKLLPVCSKKTKYVKESDKEKAIFKLFSLGIATNRDEWVYDFNRNNLIKKGEFLSKEYNKSITEKKLNIAIKWH